MRCLIIIAISALLALSGASPALADDYAALRKAMVHWQIKARGVSDARVLKAMTQIPRHLFVPEPLRPMAYADTPLPIGHGQTISQPYIAAYMTEALELDGTEKILEIGTGSGYQAALLALTAREVYSIEIVKPLCRQAKKLLAGMGYKNLHLLCGDGYKGWPRQAPFDRIIVTCAPERIPPPLLEQLAPGGRMIIPVGPRGWVQELVLVNKDRAGKISQKSLMSVRFVPLVRD